MAGVTLSPEAARDADQAGLRYVSDGSPGLTRQRAGRGFRYRDADGHRVTDAATLARIRALAIPPAWSDVWICPSPRGHLQATGRDARGRKQYRYHQAFRRRRDAGKFDRLIRFGERLPALRRQARRDLARRGLPRAKVVAAVIRLMELTLLRVGNDEYARLNRSFGLSTLRNRHARVRGGSIRFRFRGKGGRLEEVGVSDRRLAAVVRRCQDLPGQELFEYLDSDGRPEPIDSADVNGYIRAAMDDEGFSAKDLRTWAGTMLAFRALRSEPPVEDGRRTGRAADGLIRDAVREAAKGLGNTPAVARSSYVHPALLDRAGIAGLEPGRRGADGRRPTRNDELALLRLLRRHKRARRSGARSRPSAARSRPSAARSRPPAARSRGATGRHSSATPTRHARAPAESARAETDGYR